MRHDREIRGSDHFNGTFATECQAHLVGVTSPKRAVSERWQQVLL